MQETNFNRKERDMMSLEGFTSYMRIGLQSRLGSGYKVVEQKVTKNNGVQYLALRIEEPDMNIAPVLQMEAFYCKYINNSASLERLEQELLECYLRTNQPVYFNSNAFFEWEYAGRRIAYKLINYEKNRKLLREVPHVRFLDLAIVFYYVLEEIESATILIRNEHLANWKKDTLDLYRVAKRNTPRLFPHTIKGIVELMDEIQPGVSQEVAVEQESPMYVLINNVNVNGAVCMLYSNVLKDFADKVCSDVYILPSSTHEVILIPAYACENTEKYLAEMVAEVNYGDVPDEDILSDNIYRYVRNLDRIVLVGGTAL